MQLHVLAICLPAAFCALNRLRHLAPITYRPLLPHVRLLPPITKHTITPNRLKIVLDWDVIVGPHNTELQERYNKAVQAFVQERLGVDANYAKHYLGQLEKHYGTATNGLVIEKKMNPDAVEEHLNANIDYSCIKRNVALAEMLKSMDADIIIFADASPRHAERVVAELGILEHTHMLFTSIPGELNLPLKSTSTEAAFERVGHFLETSPNLISYVGDIVSYLQLADRLGWKPIRVDGFLIPGVPCDCLTIETIQHLPNVLKPITPERE